jgi:hypothetical protein
MGEGARLVLTEIAYQRTGQHRPPPTQRPCTRYRAVKNILREVNGSQNYRHPPKFVKFEDVTWRATKLVFAKEGISR